MPVRTPSNLGSADILLVDDNANGLAARKSVLQEMGHRITIASCGATALEQVEQHNFDLVVTDYKMPRMDGLELIRRLRKQAPGLPIILISGYTDALGLNEELTGADAVLQKSASEVSHLVRAVNRLLRSRPAGKKPPASKQSGVSAQSKRRTG